MTAESAACARIAAFSDASHRDAAGNGGISQRNPFVAVRANACR